MKPLTTAQRNAIKLQTAHGRAHLLAIGVGEHLDPSIFHTLKVAPFDAESVLRAFQDIPQLNAEPSKLSLLTTVRDPKPSRGQILSKVKSLAAGATSDDRIIFFFSGHGHKINEKFYLVPNDVYDANDPAALVSFDEISEILSGSDAKQKIALLDCCYSGPDTSNMKVLPTKASDKFLAEYLKRTQGIAILTSSTSEQTSTIQSPNPKLSLFTHFLVSGLRGETSALAGYFLTIPSLFGYVSQQVILLSKSFGAIQNPSIKQTSDGVMMLADFTPRIVSADQIDLSATSVGELVFDDAEPLRTKDVLTEIRTWSYSVEWIERKVNDALADRFGDVLAEKKTKLRKAMGWNPADVLIEDNGLRFPNGDYSISYEADTKRDGKLLHSVTIEPGWFEKPGEIPKIISSLGLTPSLMRLKLTKACNPEAMQPGLTKAGWEITSEGSTKLTCKRNGYFLTIMPSAIELDGLAPSDVFGSAASTETKGLALSILTLLPPP